MYKFIKKIPKFFMVVLLAVSLPGVMQIQKSFADDPIYTLSGNITDYTNTALSGLSVGISTTTTVGGIVDTGHTDSSGNFSVSLLPANNYYVEISGVLVDGTNFEIDPSTSVDLTTGDNSANYELPNMEAATMTVTTKDQATSPIPNELVNYEVHDDTHTSTGISGSYKLSMTNPVEHTDGSGELLLPVYTGTGNVHGTISTTFFDSTFDADYESVNLPTTVTGDFSRSLTYDGYVHTYSGTVIDADSNPVEGASVELYSDPYLSHYYGDTFTDASGNFSFISAASLYIVRVQKNYIDDSNSTLDLIPDDYMDMSSGNVVNNFQLPDVSSTLSVNIKDNTYANVPDQEVAYDQEKSGMSSAGISGTYHLSLTGGVNSDEDGNVQFRLFKETDTYIGINNYQVPTQSTTSLTESVTGNIDMAIIQP